MRSQNEKTLKLDGWAGLEPVTSRFVNELLSQLSYPPKTFQRLSGKYPGRSRTVDLQPLQKHGDDPDAPRFGSPKTHTRPSALNRMRLVRAFSGSEPRLRLPVHARGRSTRARSPPKRALCRAPHPCAHTVTISSDSWNGRSGNVLDVLFVLRRHHDLRDASAMGQPWTWTSGRRWPAPFPRRLTSPVIAMSRRTGTLHKRRHHGRRHGDTGAGPIGLEELPG